MAIVTIGRLPLQVPETHSVDFILQIVKQIEGTLPCIVARILDECLETEVERVLGRKYYQRRKKAKRQEQGAYCSRCRSHQRQDFRRNGHYLPNLVTGWGQVQVHLPQVKCRCGGNVKMHDQTLPPRQRIWDDIHLEVQAEYGRGLSYWQIKLDLDHHPVRHRGNHHRPPRSQTPDETRQTYPDPGGSRGVADDWTHPVAGLELRRGRRYRLLAVFPGTAL